MDGKRVGVNKIFVAEAGIFAHGDGLRFENWSGPEIEVVVAHFHWAPKSSGESRRNPFLQSGIADQNGSGSVEQPEANKQHKNPLEPATETTRGCRRRLRDNFQRGLETGLQQSRWRRRRGERVANDGKAAVSQNHSGQAHKAVQSRRRNCISQRAKAPLRCRKLHEIEGNS